MKHLNKVLFVAVLAMATIGTVATANKRATALRGPQLPNWQVVKAWNLSDETLVRQMREYLKTLAR
jgi:hypothetical protein